MKNIVLACSICIALFASAKIHAESIVYIFCPEILTAIPNQGDLPKCEVSINGEYSFNPNGVIKKHFSPTSPMIYNTNLYSKSVKKCTFTEEGKIIVNYSFDHMNGITGAISPIRGEIQLDIAEGETYYIEVGKKCKELPEKKGLKNLDSNKFILLEEWTQSPTTL